MKQDSKLHRCLVLFLLAVSVAGLSAACDRPSDDMPPFVVTIPSQAQVVGTDPEESEAGGFSRTNETSDRALSSAPEETTQDPVSETSKSEAAEATQVTTGETTEQTKENTVQTTILEPIDPPAKTASMTAFSSVDITGWSDEEIRGCFYFESISDEVFARMEGKSFKSDCTTQRSDLRYVRVLHIGFDGSVRVGELVANKKIAQDFVDIFYELYLNEYPIEKMVLVDEYGADDNLSMADNNTSCFNFRRVVGSSTLSRHALGMAIDVNPLYNPWVYELDGEPIIDPPGGAPYVDRTVDCPYIIDHDDLCYKLLIQHGFTWGGDWNTSKDYQHFSKTP